MNKYITFSTILFTFSFFLFSCEPDDIANTASAVEGTYQVTSISAKTGQGQADITPKADIDQIVITKTDDRLVKIDFLITTAKVSFGTSTANLLQTTYYDVTVEGNQENGSFRLTKAFSQDNNATLTGSISDNGQLSLQYNIAGTELFLINAVRP
ncbi:hypothetical protein [Flammeovirga sp. SubArs3]|uniref:hypothetical protein n=1 Tax=Flammeovirga sp. SubArs3 TaxID=2995316 RepID=UPI00248D3AA7|nr:hypothetical protein [Flammeovirga sp. SubArs3]